MLAGWGFVARRLLLGMADRLVTARPIRWMWLSPSGEELVGALVEFRPSDRESALEMMAGRYLLGSRLVDTQGISPFALDAEAGEWSDELHSFSWLRHFRDARDDTERRFARTLVLDWIGREGRFDRYSWEPALCSRRVMNWLRHLNLLLDDASPEQARTITRSLGSQIQSLKARAGLVAEPQTRLSVGIALTAVALCDDRRASELDLRFRRLLGLLDAQIDDDGLHRSRCARIQVQALIHLETLRQALSRDHPDDATDLGVLAESMHRALDAVSLSTGEPAYFNGTGQLAHDLVVALQVQSTARFRRSGTAGGYGRLVDGKSVVVADGGLVPAPAYSGEAHASALAFEFSHGAELVVGNCGPAPEELESGGLIFRQGIAHSAITINGVSAATLKERGPLAGRLLQRGLPGTLEVGEQEPTLLMRTHGYERRYGVTVERRLTLMAEGKTLVGQDVVVARRTRRKGAVAIARFHLALGTTLEADEGEDVLRLRLASGAVWTFLWEGARMRIEDSVRQSSYFGFHRIKQIVLEAPLEGQNEIDWIFTLDESRSGVPRRR